MHGFGSRDDTMGAAGNNASLLEVSNAVDNDNKNFFNKSDKGDGQSLNDEASEFSRAGAGYPSITLGRFRESAQNRRSPPPQQL